MKKIVIIKIGSSTLLTERNKLDTFRIAHIADQIRDLRNSGVGVVLVVSGAVACGSELIDLSMGDESKQAAAGIGQVYLSATLGKVFAQKQLPIAQVLVTRDMLASEINKSKIRNLVSLYLQKDIIPVFNENDVVDLNSFGGNDILAAELALLLNVDELVILSTQEKSLFGVGGGETKQQAIQLLKKNNIQVYILDGKTENILSKVYEDGNI